MTGPIPEWAGLAGLRAIPAADLAAAARCSLRTAHYWRSGQILPARAAWELLLVRWPELADYSAARNAAELARRGRGRPMSVARARALLDQRARALARALAREAE